MSAEVPERARALQAKLASAVYRGRSEERVAELRRDYWAAQMAEYVEKCVAKAPPLTKAQRDRIATLLAGGGSK